MRSDKHGLGHGNAADVTTLAFWFAITNERTAMRFTVKGRLASDGSEVVRIIEAADMAEAAGQAKIDGVSDISSIDPFVDQEAVRERYARKRRDATKGELAARVGTTAGIVGISLMLLRHLAVRLEWLRTSSDGELYLLFALRAAAGTALVLGIVALASSDGRAGRWSLACVAAISLGNAALALTLYR